MEDIQKGLQTVINKAWEDAQFKSALVTNPKSAIHSATGLAVPDNVNIVVNDQTNEDIIYLNIPPKPDFDSMELTDEQLEQVAGGEVAFAILTLSIAASALVIGTAVNNERRDRGKKNW